MAMKFYRVTCFFCSKLMPSYAPGTMVRRAKLDGEEDRFICSRCYKKITMVIDSEAVVKKSLVPDVPPPSGKRVVEV